MRGVWKVVLALAAVIGASGAVDAYQVSPLRLTLAPTGAGAAARVVVTNTESQPITLSFRALRISVAADGNVTREPAGSAFTVFPPQAVVQPNATQNVQLRYTGGPALPPGLYSLHVTQVPINAMQGQAQIAVATEFLVAVAVQPAGAKPAVTVQSVNRLPDGGWRIGLANGGDGFGHIGNGRWQAVTRAGPVPLPTDAFDVGGSGYIFPGQSRTMVLKPDKAAGLGDISAVTMTGGD